MATTMLTTVKALLQDSQVQQKLKEAKSQGEGIKVLTTAGTEKGYEFTAEDLTQMLTLFALEELDKLEEKDILAISGGAVVFLTTGTKSWCSCPAE